MLKSVLTLEMVFIIYVRFAHLVAGHLNIEK